MGSLRAIALGVIVASSTARADGGLGWPATTIAAIARHSVIAYDTADRPTRKRIGVIAGGARLAFKQVVATPKDPTCRAWVELDPLGWVCQTELAPTDKPAPDAAATPAPAAKEAFAAVRPAEGTDGFDTIDQIKQAAPARHVGPHTYVAMRGGGTIAVDGARYVWTDQGFLKTTDIYWLEAAPYQGIELAPKASLAFGWAVARVPGQKIKVRDQPSVKGAVVRELAPRDIAPILETQQVGELAFARIGEGEWVDAVELRKPALVARPTGVAATERWLDVDLDQQVLLAYEGDAPVFATVVSTGRAPDWVTPTGIYQIRGKEAKTRMQAPVDLAESWNVADVPWSMRFRKNFALHGTYWHDGFGRQRSHGCVNLSTGDAKRLWDFVTPMAPVGWTEAETTGPGTAVRIHSLHDPDPKWLDYEGRPTTSGSRP